MPVKDLHFSGFSQETLTKLDIFESYLRAWLPVFVHSKHPKIVICDFFAGGGKDLLGQKGSPLRIINSIDYYRVPIIKNNTNIVVLFNELDKRKFDSLKETADKAIEKLNLGKLVCLRYARRDFKEIFFDCVEEFNFTPSLLFIDQNGVKQVQGEVFQTLINLSKTDFLFFIASSFFNRFNYQKYFPDLDYKELRNKPYELIHKGILDYYKSKIPQTNKTQLYPFSIKKGANVYGLIFGSKHPLGVNKFLRIAWRQNELNGQANFDIDNDELKRLATLFPEEKSLTKIEKFQKELINYIMIKEKVSNLEIYDFTLGKGHIPKHAIEVLKSLKNEGKIHFERGPYINYTNCYKDYNIVFFETKK